MGVGVIELFIFHQCEGQSDELVGRGGSGFAGGVLIVEALFLVVLGEGWAMGIEGERDLVECHPQQIFAFMGSG